MLRHLFQQRVGRQRLVRVRWHVLGDVVVEVVHAHGGHVVALLGLGVVHEVEVAHLVAGGGADVGVAVAARGVVGAAGGHDVALGDGHVPLDRVEGLRPLRVALGYLQVLPMYQNQTMHSYAFVGTRVCLTSCPCCTCTR